MSNVFHPWSRPPKVRVKSNILGVIIMKKFSAEFKLKVVKEYLEGSLSYMRLAKKYDSLSDESIKNWVKYYQKLGVEGLKVKPQSSAYSVQFKMDVLHFMKQSGSSPLDTAIAFGITSPALIWRWNKTFQEKGIEGLKPKQKPKRCTCMSKKNTNKQIDQSAPSTEELKREIELLRLENAYLKKLQAFQKNPKIFLEKHKQQWHSHSKKKDSN